MHSPWPWLAIAYLCGSIPFGLLISKALSQDIRKLGSGNIGATNVGRMLGRKWGGLCFILDVLKGTIPTLSAGLTLGYAGQTQLPAGDAWTWLAIAATAMIGHIYPVWLGFRGGKGVATGLGIMLGLWPLLTLAGLASLLTWLLFASCMRYVSLASIIAALLLPYYVVVAAVVRQQPLRTCQPYLIATCLMALLVIVRHRTNIRRLIAGTETRLGSRPGK